MYLQERAVHESLFLNETFVEGVYAVSNGDERVSEFLVSDKLTEKKNPRFFGFWIDRKRDISRLSISTNEKIYLRAIADFA